MIICSANNTECEHFVEGDSECFRHPEDAQCPLGYKLYRVPVSWEEAGEIELMGSDIESACDMVEADSSIGLPEGFYIDDSWTVDRELAKDLVEI